MAAISSISNGEALSSVRTKLNSVITEINLLDPTDWVDYSATSTVVGWSVLTTKQIRYRIVGKMMFVYFNLVGTSNSINTTFTLPNNSVTALNTGGTYCANNGVFQTNGQIATLVNSNIIYLYQNNTTWTASGTKYTFGQFFYEIA